MKINNFLQGKWENPNTNTNTNGQNLFFEV